MKKLIVFIVILGALGSAGWAYYANRNRPEPQVTSLPVSRGDVLQSVQATGTLEAVTTVDVGTQVSGVVQELHADFNQIVRQGQVIARLDPSILQVQIESQTANVVRAEADVERLKVTLADAEQKFTRADAMFKKELLPRSEYEAAELAVKNAQAQIKSSEASLTQSRAALNQARVNLGYTVIKSPIDGIVISRNVDPGQTVASSMNAPTLYVIAADLSKMQVIANIDEAEIGQMRPGQHVTFRVDAYPTDQFTGTVEQVRLQPTVVQNVVVYSTVISVPNPQLKLKPGMTANVIIEIARRNNVLRLPTAAVRFRPTEAMFQVLNQQVPPEAQRGAGGRGNFAGGGGRGGRGGRDGGQATGAPTTGSPATPPANAPTSASPSAPAAATAPAQSASTGGQQGQRPGAAQQQQAANAQGGGGRPQSAESRGGGDSEASRGGRGGFGGRGFDPNMSPEEREKRRQERMASMTPEQREQFMARMRERDAAGGQGGFNRGGAGQGGNNQGFGGRNDQGGGRGGNQMNAARDPSRGIVGNVSAGAAVSSGATTIDALFAPLVVAETRGRVWMFENKLLKSTPVRLGVSDGTYSELLEGDLKEGQEVVVNMVTGLEPVTRPGQTGTGNPLMGPQRGPGGGGPGRGGGGGRGF